MTVITISGEAGCGKSSVAKLLAKKLNFEHYSAGDAQREIAKEKGITILELGRLEAEDDSIDRMIDEKMGEICRKADNAVVDAWLGAYFAPQSIKIFLDASLDTRARRRLEQRRAEERFEDLENAKSDMQKRAEVNRKRWIEYYGFDYTEKSNYDYIINTEDTDIEGVVKRIIEKLKADNKI